MKRKVYMTLALATFGGVLLAFSCVNPYGGKIPLSELVLQLSGSEGEFALHPCMLGLTSFVVNMIPYYLFEIYFGTEIYREFCTASTYVFSRYPKRLKWYFGEVFTVGGFVILYQFVLLITVIFTTILRYQIKMDMAGIILLIYHFVLHTIWIYSVILSINLLAIFVGSSTSYLIVLGSQMVCLSLLGVVHELSKNLNIDTYQRVLLKWNPITRLVLGWHSSQWKEVNQVLNSPYSGIELNFSILLSIGFCTIILAVGAVLVKKHDLLISDIEMGVM